MTSATPSRRERLRAETASEIKRVALRLLAGGGPDAVSLRAIAREMGMTAGAIYGYYPTRDDLITALINDVYTSLVDTMEAARNAYPRSDAAGRLLAWGEAFRVWAIGNPAGFRLVYGDPVTGYRVPEGGAAPEAAHRACIGLAELVSAAWPHVRAGQPSAGHRWSDFAPALSDSIREAFPELPAEAVALALRLWGRMHGLVALEVYGHLRAQTTSPEKLYRAELLDLAASLGLGDQAGTT
ncbi:TetR/AcrR family transcriptional regulator [Rugosimonospora acidiphila]|uniref:TetR/AcrR family transcriptional regulator n=1 Tax=Rugosimonospora acidiphila TaxID=556531 RepID=A0ABP9RTP4_9ACTN